MSIQLSTVKAEPNIDKAFTFHCDPCEVQEVDWMGDGVESGGGEMPGCAPEPEVCDTSLNLIAVTVPTCSLT